MFAASKTASVSGGYQISRSLRFNRPDSAYLTRTPSSTGSRTTFTLSLWIKLGNFTTGNDSFMWASGDASVGDAPALLWKTFDGSCSFVFNAGTSTDLKTTAVYRDPSAWYHIVVAVDTTQATASNRIKMYVNGVQITSFSASTYPSQNLTYNINTSSYPTYLGCLYAGGYIRFWEGYQTEVNFIDGQALTPSSFGETNAQTGVWQPKAYSGSYGTNGFYLNFSDNSNTTAATLGKDYSGNGNNWTPNNFSVTAGAGNDSLVDSPTSYGTDTGVGGTVRGNYATLNPLNSASGITNGNLDFLISNNTAYGSVGFASGKWYWETTINNKGDAVGCGISPDYMTITSRSYFGTSGSVYCYFSAGTKYNGSSETSYGATFTTGDIIGTAVDLDAGTITFYKNGTSQGTAFTGLTGGFKPQVNGYLSNPSVSLNFGQRPFAYTAPSGYKALCTQNLPTPTIGATTATQAGTYYNAVLYTGNGSSRSITGLGFQPDFTWIKDRSAGFYHRLADAVRGAGKELYSNDTGAETTNNANGYVTSFNSDGFSLGTGVGVNQNGTTYVAWNWKANGSGSTNTAGSITSTVSANTTSGFSVVTYTGNGTAGATIGHGLGVAPSMMFIKGRTNVDNWHVYSSALGNTGGMFLNLTNAFTTSSFFWNNTSPTSTVFTVSSGSSNNSSGVNYVAYCFSEVAGYSKFGSYTGNGSTDGPFVFTGFRPAYVMFKRTDVANDWVINDATRSAYNQTINVLYANDSAAENTTGAGNSIDILSNGFKLRQTNNGSNASGGTYIFMAFASAPQKFALAR